MKTPSLATRVLAGLMPVTVLFANPLSAQDAPAAPPPATATPPAEQPAAPVPANTTSSSAQAKYQASLDAATGQTEPNAEGGPPRPIAAAKPRRSLALARIARAPAAASTSTPTELPAIVPTPTPQPTALPAPSLSQESTPVTTTTETVRTGTPLWLWVVGALALLAVAFALFGLLRRRDEEYPVATEPGYAPVPFAAAVAQPAAFTAAPTGQAELVAPAADELAAMTDAAAPVPGRPWIELSLRPMRAGGLDGVTTVEFELTLANAGEATAKDVRVTTSLIGSDTAASTDLKRLRGIGHAGPEVQTGDIAAAAGKRVDATLSAPRSGAGTGAVRPIVVADVRYSLPGGCRGRTSAAFAIGVATGDDALAPFAPDGGVREDVGAALHGLPERS